MPRGASDADNLQPLAEALLALPQVELAVLAVDDNSPDGTGIRLRNFRLTAGDSSGRRCR